LTQGIQNITSDKNRAFWRLLACKFAGLKNSVIVPRPVLALESCISLVHLLTEKTQPVTRLWSVTLPKNGSNLVVLPPERPVPCRAE
jgi:hypothetical protein